MLPPVGEFPSFPVNDWHRQGLSNSGHMYGQLHMRQPRGLCSTIPEEASFAKTDERLWRKATKRVEGRLPFNQ